MNGGLSHPILEKIEKNGVRAVVLDVPSNEIMTENVFGIGPSDEMIWQIERDEFLATNYPGMNYVSITDVSMDEKIIKCHHFSGLFMLVDIASGKILDRKVSK